MLLHERRLQIFSVTYTYTNMYAQRRVRIRVRCQLTICIFLTLPFIVISIVIIHLLFLHLTDPNNPIGINLNIDKIPIHPYFTYKGIVGFIVIFFYFNYTSFVL